METPTMASSAKMSAYYDPDAQADLLGLRRMQVGAIGAFKEGVIPRLQKQMEIPVNQRRVVQVLIADTNQNVPLDQCLLYNGDEKLTDATDQELFFEINIKELLDAHNEKRTKIVDKTIKDRTVFLEPAKVRDLKMVVVTVATL